MNPNVDSSPGMRLPEPLPVSPNQGAEQAPSMESGQNLAPAAPVEMAPRPPMMPSTTIPALMPSPPQDDTATTATPQPAAPAAADSDTIEKEWVVKAKQIVSATRQDPYQQNRQLAAFKADYLQKRYNKIVKLSE